MPDVRLRELLGTGLLMLCAALCMPAHAADAPSDQEILVFAAASLANVLDEIGTAYTQQTKQPVKFSYAASSALARQLEAGARADVFFSADLEWMDYVQARGLIDRALGIVYETDARVEKRVRVVDFFPADSHPPIVYPVAVTAKARPAARQFVEFLQSAPAQEAFKKYGFQEPPKR